MYTNYMYPFYRSGYFMPAGWPVFAGGGYPYGYGRGYGSNIIGSAVSNQSLINTGNAIGINQISTPTVIW